MFPEFSVSSTGKWPKLPSLPILIRTRNDAFTGGKLAPHPIHGNPGKTQRKS